MAATQPSKVFRRGIPLEVGAEQAATERVPLGQEILVLLLNLEEVAVVVAL